MWRDIPWDINHNTTTVYHILICVLCGMLNCKQVNPFLHVLLKPLITLKKILPYVYGHLSGTTGTSLTTFAQL